MGALSILWGLRAILPSPRAVWTFLTHPVGIVLTMLLLAGGGWVVGDIHGKRLARAECQAEKDSSKAAAKAADERIAAEARATAEVQAKQAAERDAATKAEVQAYVEELAKRTGESCRAGGDADDWNRGLGVSDDGVPGAGAKPAGRGERRSEPRALPKGKGQ